MMVHFLFGKTGLLLLEVWSLLIKIQIKQSEKYFILNQSDQIHMRREYICLK